MVACTLALSPDRFLKLSGIAAKLAIGVRAGDDIMRLAERCGSSATATAAACAILADKLAVARAKPQRDVTASFTAHRPWLTMQRANAIGRLLAPLFAPVLMIAAGATAVIITVVALATQRPEISIGTFWASYALTLGLLVIHEFGHAGACVYHGARVGAIGVAIYLIYPALYCDVSDAWRLSRARRVAIDLGGIYLQMIATAAVAIAWRLTGVPILYMVAVT
ncbi:MAG TPA: hypothetical protein VK427_13035, partial [Kofleriaceae bacterium]|nr:hypothetical protein [Kofleriaceae bacterium]